MRPPTVAELLRTPPGDRRLRLALHARYHRAALATAVGDDRLTRTRRTRHGRALRKLAAISRSVGANIEDLPMDRPDRIVAEIPRGSREAIRISLSERRGRMACEARVVAATPRGPKCETPRGFRVPLERLPETIAALQVAEREARRLGLMPDPAAPIAEPER